LNITEKVFQKIVFVGKIVLEMKFKSLLSNYFTSIPKSISILNYRFYLVAHVAYNFAFTVHFLWLILFLILGVTPLFIFNIFSVGLFTCCIIINRKGHHMLTTVLGMSEVIVHQIYASYLIGAGSGYPLYILVVSLYPFIMPAWRFWVKILLFTLSIIGYLLIEIFIKSQPPIYVLESNLLYILNLTNILFAFVCLSIWGTYFNYAVYKTDEELQLQISKSDQLLLNILPYETAEELKNTGTTKAKDFNEVTVLFTDFQNFTSMSEQLSAQELVNEINYCYSAFDSIITKHSVEKIKTIGDSYMCAGGLPVANKTHAEDTVRAALEIRDFMLKEEQIRKEKGSSFFEVRIGCNTGSVVAGIVGNKKFAYDIWGDTVNIASRMESSGEAGKVNISGTTFEIVKDKFRCIHRGKIQAKNKGEIDMYFVEEPLEALVAHPIT